MRVKPYKGRVLVRRAEEPEKVGSFWVPDTARDVRPGAAATYQAEVIAVGEPWWTTEGNPKGVEYCNDTSDLKPGDQVLVEHWTNFPYGDDGCCFVWARHVRAKLDGVDAEGLVLQSHQGLTGDQHGRYSTRAKPDHSHGPSIRAVG